MTQIERYDDNVPKSKMNLEKNYVFERNGDQLSLNYQGTKFKPRTSFDSNVMELFLNTEKEILALRGIDVANVVDTFALEPKTTSYEIKSPQNGNFYGCSRKEGNPHSLRPKGHKYEIIVDDKPYEIRTNSGFTDTVGHLSNDGANWKYPASRIVIEVTDRDFAVYEYLEHNGLEYGGGFPMWFLDPYGTFHEPENLEKCEELVKEGLKKIYYNLKSQ